MSKPVVIEGFHACKHALRFGAKMQDLVTADKAGLIHMLDRYARDIKDKVLNTVRVLDFNSFNTYSNVAIRTPLAGKALKQTNDFSTIQYSQQPIVLLENPKNHENIGAIVRTAAGMNALAVVTTGSTDPWHKNAVRAAQGLHYALPVFRISHVQTISDIFTKRPGIVFDEGGQDIETIQIPRGAILCFGSERNGVSDHLRELAHKIVSIDQQVGVSSYNVAATAAMALFAVRYNHD